MGEHIIFCPHSMYNCLSSVSLMVLPPAAIGGSSNESTTCFLGPPQTRQAIPQPG